MNELKYCKFCDKEKPIKDFAKSGFAIKNICRECQNKKNNQIYKNSKKIEKLEQENKQLKMVVDDLKKYLELNIELIKEQPSNDELTDNFILSRFKNLLDILKEVSE